MLLPNSIVMSGSEQQLRAMSGAVVLLQPGSVLMISEAPVTTEGHADA